MTPQPKGSEASRLRQRKFALIRQFQSYFQQPGDGRGQPHIPASDIVWSVVMSRILRVTSFLRLEWLVHFGRQASAVPRE